jgi:hypothetical protein
MRMPWRPQLQARHPLRVLWLLLSPPPERLPLPLHSKSRLQGFLKNFSADVLGHHRLLMSASGSSSAERLQRAWGLLYGLFASGQRKLRAAGLTSRGLRDDIGGSLDILRGCCGQGCGQSGNLRGGHWWGPSCTMKGEPLTNPQLAGCICFICPACT